MRVAYLLPPIAQPNGWRTHAVGFLNAVSRFVTPVLFVAQEDEQAAAQLFPLFQRCVLPSVQASFENRAWYGQMAASFLAIQRGSFPEVDLVHSLEAYPAGLVGSWLASKLKRPHLLTAHGTYGVLAYGSQPHRAIYQTVLRSAAALCPVSPETGDHIRKYFPGAVENLTIRPILNGNDFYQSVPREEALCRQPNHTPTILSVGAVKPRKGYHVSLAAFALLRRMLPDAQYWIVGAADQRKYTERLKANAAEQGLDGVHWLGKVSDSQLRDCYRQAAVFLLTPQEINRHFEGFGLVYLEAGAFGLPVVGVRSGGVASAIRHGETGLVLDPGDIQGIVNALYQLLTDPDLARRMGEANRRWAETLTWEKNAVEHFDLYQEVAVQRKMARRPVENI